VGESWCAHELVECGSGSKRWRQGAGGGEGGGERGGPIPDARIVNVDAPPRVSGGVDSIGNENILPYSAFDLDGNPGFLGSRVNSVITTSWHSHL
jgi:hypothetical protein